MVVLPAFPIIPIHLLQLPDRLVILFAYQELPALGNRILILWWHQDACP